MSTEIGLIGGETHQMPGGYKFEAFKFTGLLEKELDGGFYYLRPGKATRVVRITGEVSAWESLIRGNARFIIYNENSGKTSHKDFDTQNNFPLPVAYGEGDNIVWIALDRGATIISMTRPPFRDDMETEVEIDSGELPQEFWDLYHFK